MQKNYNISVYSFEWSDAAVILVLLLLVLFCTHN